VPHEAAVSDVQLLLAGTAGPPVTGLYAHEPAAAALLEALAAAQLPAPATLPDPDVLIPAGQLPAVLDGVRAALRARLAATPRADNAGAYDAAVLDVLGETVRIRVRDEGHHALKRLNDLYVALDGLAGAGEEVRLLAVPWFDDLDRAVLRTVREGPVLRTDLPAVVRRRLAELERVGSEPETAAEMRRQADAAGDPDRLEKHLDRLRQWKLLKPDADEVVATDKLRRIRL